jgi:hypothetical protein
MPRPKKTDKFFFYSPKKSGYSRGKMLVGVNHRYEGGTDNLNLQDLIDFLKENEIDPSNVKVHASFSTYASK